MKYLPGIATDVQAAMEQGQWCWSCQCEFVTTHGHRVLCPGCWTKTMPPDRDGCVKATHDEVAVDIAKAKARQAKNTLRRPR